MPNYRYKAITQAGEIVTGSIAAPTAAEVARRIEYLGLVPVDTVTEERAESADSFFTLTQAREVRGRDRVHARPRAASQSRRAAR